MSSATDLKAPGAGRSVIDEGTIVKGSIVAASPVVVFGVLEGEVTGPALEVEAGGKLVGKARVTELRCRGELSGEFDAEELTLTGRVHDQTVIRARTLVVSPAPGQHDESGSGPAATFGECQIDVGELPGKEQVIARAREATGDKPQGVPELMTLARRQAPRPPPLRAELARPVPVRGELAAPPPTAIASATDKPDTAAKIIMS
jgi:hypothetical protein